ncbi:nuclear transport factor 2 family protein [Streptomyces sp. YC504]|uniref:Nuclear transport factor 2 family protein n=1 Tax=Streptomyces mesophilus TaxID=1775132 RepID=A0A6G4XB90_9ACTN|nr:nuclear transport factor 2 family protein [Streptomyces mesophilus]NGO74120.1 nuclear transport factor 2 family protein [Streptomyces mesophilus]
MGEPDVPTYGELMKAWVDSINAQDIDGMVLHFTEDVQFEDVAMKRTGQGREELRTLFLDWVAEFPSTRAELLSVTSLGTVGVTEWELTVTRAEAAADGGGSGPAPAATPIRLRGACIDELGPDGRIRVHRDYWNTADLAAR